MVDTTILIGVIVGSSAALVLLVILVLTFYQEIWRVYMTPLWRDVVAFCTGTEQRNNTGGNVVSTEAEHTFLYDASDLGLPPQGFDQGRKLETKEEAHVECTEEE